MLLLLLLLLLRMLLLCDVNDQFFRCVSTDRAVLLLTTMTSRRVEIAALELDTIPAPEFFTVDSTGVEIAGSFYENPADTGCAVLFLHGRGGQRTELIDYIPLFWDRGCHALVYDLRSRGDSGGDVQS